MKTKEEFYSVMEKVMTSDYFDVDDAEVLTYHQQNALEKYGGFLALVPREDYPQVSFDVLNAIYTFNLAHSEHQYRIATTGATRDELRPIKDDIKLAKQYKESITMEALIELIDLNIQELEQYLEWRITEAKRKPAEEAPNIITFDQYQYEKGSRKSFKRKIKLKLNRFVKRYLYLKWRIIIQIAPNVITFDPYKYETGSRKFLKTDIEATLNRIVERYNLHGHSKSIKKLTSSL